MDKAMEADWPQKGSLAWWVQQAAKHAEDMGEEGFLIDRDHWERIVFAAQTEVGRAAIRAMGGE